ncbi:hypothetical protein [Microvirga roseola]|uniref:hypothetical protein n=1 Tax=Microvirga roseola TaxID=2883126 RepID=UPI001E29E7EF|nr:hypothetical protein [Microvirga roseola]
MVHLTVALAAAWIAFSVQIRIEEEHLGRMHGAAYGSYRTVASSWFDLSKGSHRILLG